jgi:hypothetical protein
MAIGQPGMGKTDFALQHHPLLTGSTRESDIEKVPVPAGPGAAVDRRDHRTDVVFLSAATLIERPLPTNLASTMRVMQRDDGHGAGSRVVAKTTRAPSSGMARVRSGGAVRARSNSPVTAKRSAGSWVRTRATQRPTPRRGIVIPQGVRQPGSYAQPPSCER